MPLSIQLVQCQQVASREACCFLVIALTLIVHDGHDLRLGEGACRPCHGNQLWKYSVDVAPAFLGEGLVTAVTLQKRSQARLRFSDQSPPLVLDEPR